MSENFPVRPLLPEGASDLSENESATFHHDWAVSGYSHPSPGLPANTDRFPGRDDPQSTGNRHGNAKDADIPCSYGDRKREKLLKQLEDLTTQVNTYETLLRELYPRLDPSSAQHVDQTLGGPISQGKSTPRMLLLSPRGAFLPILTELVPNFTPKNDQNTCAGSELGATGYPMITIDHTEEDFNRDEKIQAMGFVGEHSEMVWLYRLKRDLDQDSATPASDTSDRPSISSLNYFQDDREELANALVDTYFEAVHPAFPVVGKTIFQSQYQSFYSSANVRPGKRWLAVLNLIFAIASKYSLLADSQPLVNTGADLLFFARAWRLSLGNVALLDHPNLQQVQVEGLAAFYLLSTGQVNRSWRIIGIAIRSAVAMGLNLRNDSHSVAHLSKETRYRVWWALFMLDTVLCVMTGRPPSSDEVFCTTPLPLPYKEEEFLNEQVVQLIAHQGVRNYLMSSLLPSRDTSSGFANVSTDRTPATHGSEQVTPNVSLYFLYAVDLAFLMRQAIEALYAPGAARRSWLEMETAIMSLNNHADNWLAHLPPEFAFTELDASRPFIRQRASLAFRFYTTKLVISQPCLRRLTNVPASGPLGSTCDKMAAMCVRVASQMLDLLPDRVDASWLYGVSPWWCVLHYVMQSTTILLIELFTRTQPGTSEAVALAKKIQKALRWLREMSTKDASSERAWVVCRDIISTHGFRFAMDVDF
ncbi:uncharacterized protein N7477_005452 [Penicillium maclennaniae]|uniref:uncharacterized protein n=1 Tax=Penicillium maclennaniae TaxID=1343394 RepID=UPI0025409616|nr:uncharacterized protein N7477_005452 [Penicillium maclennaniae]KAJ5670089.1 hypothetical protein N7477_005452 [Penicillium maclennaniae]